MDKTVIPGLRPGEFNMFVLMRSCGNSDHGEDPATSLSPSCILEIGCVEHASALCVEYINKWNLGAGNWMGGMVYRDGKPYANISYNGRIWTTDGSKILKELALPM